MESSMNKAVGSTMKDSAEVSLAPGVCTSCSTGHTCSCSTSTVTVKL